MSTALVPYEGERYLARKKVFKIFGDAFYVFGPDERQVLFYVKQRAFRLREAITVYGDVEQTRPLLQIQARSVLDFGATYDVTTAEGEKVGALRRQGMRSLLRDSWSIFDRDDREIGTVEEDSMLFAFLRRFLSNLIPQTFVATVNGQQVGVFSQRFNPFIAKIDIDFSADRQNLLDRRLGIAAVVLLLAIEGRQE